MGKGSGNKLKKPGLRKNDARLYFLQRVRSDRIRIEGSPPKKWF